MIILRDTGQELRLLADMARQVRDVFDALPEPERLAVWFRISIGLGESDTAEALSMSASCVGTLVERGTRGIIASLFRKGIRTDERSVAAVLSALAGNRAPTPLRQRIAALTMPGGDEAAAEVPYGDLTGDLQY